MMDARLTFTLFPYAEADAAKARTITAGELRAMVESPAATPDTPGGKVNQPLVFSGPLPGNVRKDQALEHLSALIVEHDAGKDASNPRHMAFDEACTRLAASGIRAWLFTTWSHDDDDAKGGPRWRVILPLDTPAPTACLVEYAEAVNHILDGVLAKESTHSTRGWFIGARAGRARMFKALDGEALDTAVLFNDMPRRPLPARAGTGGHVHGQGLTPEAAASRQAAADAADATTVAHLRDAAMHLAQQGVGVARDDWFSVGQAIKSLALLRPELEEELCTAWQDYSASVGDRNGSASDALWARAADQWADLPADCTSHRVVFEMAAAHGWINPLATAPTTADGFEDVDLAADLHRDLQSLPADRIHNEWAQRAADLTEAQARVVMEEVHRRTGTGKRVLSAQLAQAREEHQRMRLASSAQGRRTIQHRPEMSHQQALELAGLIQTKDPLGLLRHASRPVRIVELSPEFARGIDTEEAPAQILVGDHSRATLIAAAEAAALYTVPGKGGPRKTAVPAPIIDQLYACDKGMATDIAGVTTWPLVAPNGEIIATSGLHEGTRLVVRNDIGGLTPYDQNAAHHALLSLRDMYLAGFEFASPLDADAALAGLFTAVQRKVVDTAPALAILAAAQSSGKTTLARRQHLVLTGRDAPLSTLPLGNDEELEKRLLSLLLTSPAMIAWDNVPDGMSLSLGPVNAALTGPTLEGRLLGSNRTVSVSTATAFVVTGNNLRLGADETSRALITRLAPGAVRPEARTFKHGDVVAHALAIRARVLRHVVGIVAGFLTHAAPGPTRTRFPRWDVHVRQSLVWAGGCDVAKVFEANSHNAEHLGALRVVLHSLRATFGVEGFTSRQVIDRLCLQSQDFCDALEALGCKQPHKTRSLGWALSAQQGRPVELNGQSIALRGVPAHNGIVTYRMVDARF